jgi:hypothetical protein
LKEGCSILHTTQILSAQKADRDRQREFLSSPLLRFHPIIDTRFIRWTPFVGGFNS